MGFSYFDDCKSAERYAVDWTDTAYTSRESDNTYYIKSNNTGEKALISRTGIYPKKFNIRIKFQFKLVTSHSNPEQVGVMLGTDDAAGTRLLLYINPSDANYKRFYLYGDGRALNLGSTNVVTPSDGDWHTIEVLVWDDSSITIYYDDAIVTDRIALEGSFYGGAYSWQPNVGLIARDADIKFRNIEVTDIRTDINPSPDTPLEVVEVGNRKFLCEKLKEYATDDTPVDLTDWTLGGATEPTEDSSNNVINLEEDTDADNQTCSAALSLSVVNGVKRTPYIVKLTFRAQSDESSNDTTMFRMSIGTDYTQDGAVYVRCMSGDWTDASLYVDQQNSPGPRINPSMGQAHDNFNALTEDVTWAVYRARGELHLATRVGGAWVHEAAFPAPGLGVVTNDYPFGFYTQHDAGEKSHVHVWDVYVYRVISEVA